VTVCIAAVCAAGRKIVVSADRMFTAGAPVNVEFETSEKKIETLAPACVALMSGNSSYASEIIQAAQQSLSGAQTPDVEHVAETVRAAYAAVRSVKVREQVVIPTLGPDFIRVEQLGSTLPQYLAAQPNLYNQLVMMMGNLNLQSDIIVAGIDTYGARIAIVTHPGTTIWLDKLGFAAIGSGGIHANMRLSLGSQAKSAGLTETVYRVYEAKKAAEAAPGVGSKTDLVVVSEMAIKDSDEGLLTKLDEIFIASGGRKPEDLSEITSFLEV
jgi:hypothetical protein